MPFPVDEQYIRDTEKALNVQFPELYKQKMMEDNGGEIDTEDLFVQLFPFFDQSDRKRLSRTCNHIVQETKSAREWRNFPENAIAIGSDGGGDLLVLLHSGDGQLQETIYYWDHETGKVEQVAESINELIST